MHLHYKERFKEKYDSILWQSFIFACQNGNPKKEILKMIHNIAPNQITLYRRHLSHDALCPICRDNEETTIHILRCNDNNGVLKQHFCTMLNKKLKGKTDEHKTIFKHIYESIIENPTGSLQGMNWEMQQSLGWECCI
jgi:galactose-1-phosphate uridylyltransferase